jgi:DNA-binding SARP family transcriptional activator/Flp pilus assembly protein TadD
VGPLRTALLTYLAVQGSRTGVTRDRLIGLFWPDVDDARARNALRNAIHQLRRTLGEGAIVSRGEELSIDTALLECDACLLDAAIGSSDAEAAFMLYRGHFLQGFHAAKAPEFEAWADNERKRIDDRVFALISARADEAVRSSDDAEAERWSERPCALRPDNEDAARRLIALQVRRGHYASALRAYDRHAAHLAREFEVRPSAAIETLAESAREQRPLPARVRVSRPTDAVPQPPANAPEPRVPSPLQEPAVTVEPIGTRRRLSGALLVGTGIGAVLLALLVVVAGQIYASRASTSAAGSNRVLVHPFTFANDSAGAGNAFADLFIHAIEEPPFDLLDGRSRVVDAASRNAGRDPMAVAASTAEAEGARYFVLANATWVGDTIHAAAALHDRELGGDRIAERAVSGPAAALPYVATRLATELFAAIIPGSGARLLPRAANLTRSADALREYVKGELYFRQRRFNEAVDAFQRAVAADSMFALAYYRLSVAADWGSRPDIVNVAAARADQLTDRLSLRERLLISGLRAWRDGRADEAEQLFRTLTDRYPEDGEAWYNLGEVLYHMNPPRGRDFRESRRAFERVLDSDSTDTEAMTHLSRIAAYDGRRGDVRRLLDHVLAVIPPRDAFELRTFRAFVAGSAAERDAVVAEARQQTPFALSVTVNRLAVFGRDIAGAERLAATLLQEGRLADARVEGHKMLAYLALARNDTAAARRHARELERAQPGGGLMVQSVVESAPWVKDSAALRELRRRVEHWRHPIGADSTIRTSQRLWIIGLTSYHLDDTLRLRTVERELGAIPGMHDAIGASAYARSVRGLLHLRRGAYEEAIPLLDEAVHFSSVHARVARGQALEALGRVDAARELYETFFQTTLEALAYAPWARQRLAALPAAR